MTQRKKMLWTLLVAICLVILLAGIFYVRYGSALRPAPLSVGLSKNILFIGNSLTSTNDLPKTMSEIAQSLGDTVIYDMYAPGGYTFMQDTTDKTALDKIKSKPWDFVVLQEQSELPALSDSKVADEVIPYAVRLDNDIHQSWPRSTTVFLQTWGYQNGDSQYCTTDPTLCDYTLMQGQLSRSYGIMAQKTAGLLAPAGDAWSIVRNEHPEIDLYLDDRHPSVYGTYLAAAVLYMTIFKKDITGASPLSLDRKTAVILQQAAKQAVGVQ